MKLINNIFLGILVAILGSCQQDDAIQQIEKSNAEPKEQYLNELLPDGIHNLVVKKTRIEGNGAKSSEEICDAGVLRSFDHSDSNFFLLDPNSSVLWPGNLLGVRTIEEGRPSSIPIDGINRNPIEVRVNVLSGTSAMTHANIQDPTAGKVQNDLNEIMNNYYESGARFPASFEISIERIYNQSQLQVALKAGYSGPSIDVSGKLGVNFSQEKARFAVTLRQRFFTVSVSPKENIIGPFGWLKEDVSQDRLTPYVTDFLDVPISEANPSGYVESVTYGRLYTMIYESSESALEVEAALNFAYKSPGTSADANLEVNYKNTIKNSKVIVRQLGGDAASGINSSLSAMSNNVDAIVGFLAEGANVSKENPGYPISYKVNYTSGNRVYNTISNVEYEEKNCELVQFDKIRIDPKDIQMQWGSTDHGTSGAELFGRIYIEVYDDKNSNWNRVANKLYWGYGIDHENRDHYDLNGEKIAFGSGKFIDFKVKRGNGARFRIISEIGECDAQCYPYSDTDPQGRSIMTYEYNTHKKAWVVTLPGNNTQVGSSYQNRDWKGIPGKVQGDRVVVSVWHYIID